MTSPRDASGSGWRRAVHLLAIVAGWVLFFWGWHRVLAGQPDFHSLRLLMAGAAIVVPVITVSWILHNQGIHRRKGPRRSVTTVMLDYRVDFNGRQIVADFRSLSDTQRIEVHVEGNLKIYRAVAGAEGAPPAEAAATRAESATS